MTGGRGFIGRNLVHRLLREPDIEIVVLDNGATSSDAPLPLSDRLQDLHADVRDLSGLESAFESATHVVHLAALPSVPRSLEDPFSTHHVNATGTLNVLEAARRTHVEYVALASSSSVYGSNPVQPKGPYDWVSPMSPYAASKLALESYAGAYSASFGLRTQVLRFFNVYGPGQLANHPYAAVIPKFVASAMNGEGVVVDGDGEQSRDFTFVGTVCEVILRTLQNKIETGRPLSLGHGKPESINALISTLQSVLGRPVTTVSGPTRVSDVRSSSADPSDLTAYFPDIDPVNLADGLAETVSWFRAQELR
ncbi:NAD-dependent epimerase/dehydratase family protein [Microbacterium foliorum]|uniref:NAD-dependent epimerase/dehydratase family protein n=1 Tax=Microbacterium foliorum TaxID=104336 RepID=UPI0028D61A97|nr:NAD-dependent epimerase/dehydratase family protein [Microbacterium foliorum]